MLSADVSLDDFIIVVKTKLIKDEVRLIWVNCVKEKSVRKMAIIRRKTEEEFYPRLCGSTLLFTVLRLRKRRTGKQEECFKDFLGIIDPPAVKDVYEASLHKYASECKNAKELPVEGNYVRFGDTDVCTTFRDEFKNNEEAVLERMKNFVSNYFEEASHKLLIKALLELVEADRSIEEHNRSLFVKPGLVPAFKDEILNGEEEIYFYNFLIGVWYYVYQYFDGHTAGQSTIEHWTEKTKDYTADKVVCNLGNSDKYDGIRISYETKTIFDTQEVIEEVAEGPKAIIMPNGIAPDLATFDPEDGVFVLEQVTKQVVSDKFSKYIEGALRNYENKKGFLDTKERPFRQFYVCNDVCQRMREVRRSTNGELRPDYNDKHLNRARSNIMLDDLGRHFCVFSGIGGMGKSMLLIKFLLDEAELYKPGGRVPIMVTLRSYKPDEKNLETLLAMELKRFDTALQLSDLYYLLDTGRAVCLLDGFDEVNRDYINDFQDELDVIKDGRPDTFFIMSSRDIPEIRTLNHYFEYDLQNLNLEQACELINRLDSDRVDDELKKDFINKLQKDAFRFNRDEKRDFVGNPLFLSLMIRTYDMIHDIPTQRYVFYEKTYIAMASEYDSKTKRMTRPFFTGLNEKTFQKYFAEFCALTYSDSKYEFDRDLMMEYFYQVVEDNGLNIDPELFIRDVTEKLCLIYKDGSVYEFIHRSFQEYFAAFYYLMMLSIDKDTVIETLKALDEKIRKDETLSMMYGMDDKTMEKFVILPCLEEMFAYNNDDADYKDYLRKYYPRLEYVTGDLDEDMCSNDDHTSAMYCFIKKQFGIDHGYISMSFERDEGYADDSEEYFWIAECWFGHTSHPGNMRLVQRFEIPTSYKEANNIYSSDDIDEVKGFLCGIDVEACLKPNPYNEVAYDIIMDNSFPIKGEFFALKSLYETLKKKYDDTANPTKKKFGLRKH